MTGPDPIFVPADYFRELRTEEIFPVPSRPLDLDLGCGDGSFLEQMALLHPERNFLGIERLLGRINKTARRLRQRSLANARVLRLEAGYTLGWLLPPRSVSRIFLLCPDPWPKKCHRKKRMINDAGFLDGLERVLVSDGEFLLKTDDAGFLENALEVMGGRADFGRADWPDDAFPFPKTGFEEQWIALGKPMHRARWRRVR